MLVLSFTNTPTTAIYTLSLHDALPISRRGWRGPAHSHAAAGAATRLCFDCQPSPRDTSATPRCPDGSDRPSGGRQNAALDRKSTRLNSSHPSISYAVFCLKKKNTTLNL